MKFKIDFVREQFPAFSEASLKRWAHFENAGGSYLCAQVKKLSKTYLREYRVQPYASYPASKEAGKLMDKGYQRMAEILNVEPDWVHVGPSTTANTYMLSQAFRGIAKEGQNIVVTNQDHEANSGHWRRLADHGVEVREWGVDQTGLLQSDDLWKLVDDKTLFVAFPHVSNIIGQINPVEEICKKLREKGVISIVDGVSYAPHAWPDINKLGTDIYLFSSYKTYGLHQGVMVIDPELARKLPNQGHYFNDYDLRKRLNPAGPDHMQVAALGGLSEYVDTLYQRHFKTSDDLTVMAREMSKLQRKYESKLLEQLFEELASLTDYKILGTTDTDGRVPTVSLYHENKAGAKLAKQLSKHGVMASGGDFYAPRVLNALGINAEHGILRLSFVHYTTEKEIKKVAKALRKLDE